MSLPLRGITGQAAAGELYGGLQREPCLEHGEKWAIAMGAIAMGLILAALLLKTGNQPIDFVRFVRQASPASGDYCFRSYLDARFLQAGF